MAHELAIARAQQPNGPLNSSHSSTVSSFNSNTIKLPHFKDGEDIVAYLDRFELLAETAGIDSDNYAPQLISLLTGKALVISHTLSREDRRDYEALKRGLLAGFHKSAESYREEFRQARMRPGETASQFIVTLGRAFDNWVHYSKVSKSYDSLREFCLLDQFMSACSPILRTHIKEFGARSLTRIVEITDDWLGAHKGALKDSRLPKTHRTPNLSDNRRANSYSQASPMQWKENSRQTGPPMTRRCYNCGSEGHIARHCRKMVGSQPLTNKAGGEQLKVNFSLDSRKPPVSKYMCQGKVNGIQTSTILRDTGCSGIIVSPKLIPNAVSIGKVTLEDYLGRVDEFPKIRCYIDCKYFTGWVEAAYAPIKSCAVLLGDYTSALIEPRDEQSANSSRNLSSSSDIVQAVTRAQSRPRALHPLRVPLKKKKKIKNTSSRCEGSKITPKRVSHTR